MNVQCEGCAPKKTSLAQVPYVVLEATEQRHQKRESKLFFLIIALIIIIFASNIAWWGCMVNYEKKIVDSTQKKSSAVDLQESDGFNMYDERFEKI